MALQLEYELPTGQTGNYWKLRGFSVDTVGSMITISVDLYKDAAASAAGKQRMLGQIYPTSIDISLPVQDGYGNPSDLAGWAYTVLASLPEFEGAESV